MDQERQSGSNPSSLIAAELRAALQPLENGQTILNEAEFGYRYIRKYLEQCPINGRVLEVGSGPCVLLSQLKIDFPHLEITGIEPIGPGFDNFEATLDQLTERYRFELQKIGYEDFNDSGRFDLIFLINVFEHLPDWRHFLSFVAEKLNPSGICLILCPNYGFPYESHFNLPIVINKSITQRLFREQIERREAQKNCHGLWESLNFVKWSSVRKEGPRLNLDVAFNTSILRQLIERLQYDDAFAQRQKNVALLARLFLGCGIVRLFESALFKNFNPYMFLEITPSRTRSDGYGS